MAFTRASGSLPGSALHRACHKLPISFYGHGFYIKMSSEASLPEPFKTEPQGRSSKRYAFGAAFGGLLTCCGLGFAYKTFTKQNLEFSNHFKRVQENMRCQELNLAKFFGPENRASCADKKDECSSCEDSTCLHKMDKEEETIVKANADLEKVLKDVKPKAMEATEASLKAYCEATELIKLFLDKAYCAIEQDTLESPQFEEVWCDVYDTALKRCEKVMEAMTKALCAWELLCRLREVICKAKACKYTECNPLLITAEEAMLCAERELSNAKARMECVQSDSCLVEQYRSLIPEFRRDMKAEVESLIAKNPDCKATFCENECPMIFTQAYKKAMLMQKELAQVQVYSGKVPSKQQKTLC